MTQKIYVDTNIWIDYWMDRKCGLIPFGDFARQMLNRVFDCEFTVLISDQILEEIKHNFIFDPKSRFDTLKDINKLKVLNRDKNILVNAKLLSKHHQIHFADALHTCFARRENAILVTRDKHFDLVTDIVEVRLPEKL